MSDQFKFVSNLWRQASTPEERRLSARVWLTDAIHKVASEAGDVAPAMALLGALEGLDFGHVDPMLKLPEGQARGGKEGAPGEVGLVAIALASVGRLVSHGLAVSAAIYIVAEELGFEVGALTSKRKHVLAEAAKASPTKYRDLIEAYKSEREWACDKSKEEIIFGLARVSLLCGLNSSLDPIP